MHNNTCKIAPRPKSIKEACFFIAEGYQTFATAMCGFVDNFQANWKNPEKQYEMIVEEPCFLSDSENVLNRKVSAIAAQLAVDFNMPIPQWATSSRWTEGEEYFDLFANADDNMKQMVRDNALHEFAKRKIFEGDGVMLRDGARKTISWYEEKSRRSQSIQNQS